MRKLLSILLASLLLAGPVPAANRAARSAKSAQYETLPLMRSRQNHLLVRAFVNGREAWLIVDSGAPLTVIALHRSQHFRLKPIPRGSELPLKVQVNGALNKLAIAHNLLLGNLNIVDVPVAMIDIDTASRPSSEFQELRADGILGADVLFPTKAVLDCERQLLVLKMYPDLPGPGPGFDYRGFSALPMQVSDNLYVNAAINGAPARLIVDTGASATFLHRSFAQQMQIPMRETSIRSSPVNLKESSVDVARLRSLSLGKIDIIDNEVGVVDLEGIIHDDDLRDNVQPARPFAGLLGAEILKRNHGIIDFGTSTLYLKAAVPPAHEKNRPGAKIRPRNRSAREGRADRAPN